MSDVNISIDVYATRLKDVFLPTLTGDTPSNHVTALASEIKQDVTDKNIPVKIFLLIVLLSHGLIRTNVLFLSLGIP